MQYFIERLSSLEGVNGPDSHLEVVVNNLKIKDKRTTLQENYRISATLSRTSSMDLSPSPTPEQNRTSSSSSSRKFSIFGGKMVMKGDGDERGK